MPWRWLHLFSYQSLPLFTFKSHNNSICCSHSAGNLDHHCFSVCEGFLFSFFNLNLGPNIGSEFICTLINTPNQTIMFLGFKIPLITNFRKIGMHNSFLTYKSGSWCKQTLALLRWMVKLFSFNKGDYGLLKMCNWIPYLLYTPKYWDTLITVYSNLWAQVKSYNSIFSLFTILIRYQDEVYAYSTILVSCCIKLA